jgi:hypothetical protein
MDPHEPRGNDLGRAAGRARDACPRGERCTFIEGSFFESVPRGDVHLFSTILHDWDDRSAQRILETVRAAAGERLVVLD